jgi:hypothetical protein
MVQVVASNNPATTVVKVTVNAPGSASRRQSSGFIGSPSAWSLPNAHQAGIFWLVLLVSCVLLAASVPLPFTLTIMSRRRLRWNFVATLLAAAALCALASCGGGSSSKQPQNFSVTLTTTAGTTAQTVNFSLTVQ